MHEEAPKGRSGPSPWDSLLHAGSTWEPPAPPVSRPHPLRMWDYMIGGKDNYRVDREAVAYVLKLAPDIMLLARAAESFLHRATAWIAGPEHGLHQFMHIGGFIPTMNSVDNIARTHSPGARFVYVTDDAVSAAHARGVLAAQARGEGEVHVLDAQFRDPAKYLDGAWLNERMDLTQPVGVLLLGMLDYTADDKALKQALTDLRTRLAPGSLIAMVQFLDFADIDSAEKILASLGSNPHQFTPRSPERIADLLSDFEFVDPGFVRCTSWRPDGEGPGLELEPRCHIAGGVAIVR